MPISKIKTSSITADAASVNLNIDANTLFLDVANNRVGVNNTSPTTALQVSGTTTSTQFRNNNASGHYGWTAGTQGAIFATNGTPGLAAQFIVDNAGRGISISTQDDNASSTGSQFRLGLGASTGGTGATIGVNDNTTGGYNTLTIGSSQVIFNRIGSESMRINASGNVGIGTDSPTSKLHISGTSDARIIIYETGASPYTATLQLASQSLANYGSIIQYGSNPETLTIQNYGRSSASTTQGSIIFQTKLGNSAIGTALTINGYTGTLQKTLTGDAIAYQLKGSYTGNPTLVEYGQSASDGYLFVKDASGNTSYITGYPSGTSYFSSPLVVGATSLSSAASAARLGVVDGSSWASGFRNHSNFTMPNMTGGTLSIGFGKAGSTRNLGKLVYNHAGDGNTSNSVGIGFWDADNILVTYANGSVWIGDSTPTNAGGATRLRVDNWTASGTAIIQNVNRSGGYQAAYGSASNPGFDWQFGKGAQTNTSTDFEWGTNGGGGTVLFKITSGGNITAAGSVNGTSKNFVIDHPLPELKDTHYLVHTSTESPTADLIYRGKVNLVAGKAEINIDTESTMTNGTFEAMVHNVQCFTSNESDWIHVRGKVEGNILTIEAQDPTATSLISWMVIGERKDEAMKKAEHTDANGKIIVEPTKQLLSYDPTKDPMNPECPDYDPTLKPIVEEIPSEQTE
jgi:hypothetical protein